MKRDTINSKELLRGHIGLYYLRIKLAWAGWMERQSSKIGRKGLMVALALFIAVSASSCLLLIIYGLGALTQGSELELHPIRTIMMPDQGPSLVPVLDTAIVCRVNGFYSYMDSLGTTSEGIRLRDSITRARPGLMDSVRAAESLFRNLK